MAREQVDSLSRIELTVLRRWAGGETALAKHARIVLLAYDGHSDRAIAAELGCDEHTVARWRVRFARDRIASLRRRRGEGENEP